MLKEEKQMLLLQEKAIHPAIRAAEIVALDREHDVALLKISGTALPSMQLGEADIVREGRLMAYTGFPIGMVLGFYPVTHQAIVASITLIIFLCIIQVNSMQA